MTHEQKCHIIDTINETTHYIDMIMNKEDVHMDLSELVADYPEYSESNDMKIGFIAGVRQMAMIMKKLINSETLDFDEANDFIKQSLTYEKLN